MVRARRRTRGARGRAPRAAYRPGGSSLRRPPGRSRVSTSSICRYNFSANFRGSLFVVPGERHNHPERGDTMKLHGQPRSPHSGVMGSISHQSSNLAVAVTHLNALRTLLRTLAISLLAAIATNCDYSSSDTTDSGCAGPYGPSEAYVPTPAHWAPVPQSDNLFAIGGDNTNNLVVVGS